MQTEDAISKDNLIVIIEGKKQDYVFDYRIIEEPDNPLLPNRNITRFSLIITDIKTTLTGKEEIKIAFNDTTKIIDLAGNTMDEGK